MPFTDIQGGRLYFRDDGEDGRPVLMLSHSLGLDHGMWDLQVVDWLQHFRILRYDTRGHGASAVTEGDYSIELLGRDALAIADAAGVRQFAFCGLSLGGMIGQWLAVSAGDRVTRLILANTSPRLSDPGLMESRRLAVLEGGMGRVADTVMARFFSPSVLRSPAADVDSARRTLLATNPIGYAGCCAAIRDMDQRTAIGSIRVPTLVISGDADVAVPWEAHGEVLSRSILGARAIRLPAAHLSNLERPRSFSTAVLDFLVPPPKATVQGGMPIRRAVLGEAHVDASAVTASELTRDFQEFITRFAWGAVWARPGLDYRLRRLLVLAMTAALGRWEEFRLHVRTGLAAELEPCDIKEILLQVAVYAGVPAANTAFKIADEECRHSV
jgi:3-oxoadipate enol-lactonase / 4-carboxymuconolactone decarboxylase